MKTTVPCPSVSVFTGTVGTDHLTECIRSVAEQTYGGSITHWIVVDGPEHERAVRERIPKEATVRVHVLPENTGRDGFNAHRIYAMGPWWVSTDCVAFLDEDNAWEPHHVAHLVAAMQRVSGARWSYGLRRLIAQDGGDRGVDRCESLGGIRPTLDHPLDFHVDTSCYLLQTDLARRITPVWNQRARPHNAFDEVDRRLCRTLLRSELFGVSRTPTVRYRLSSRSDSVKPFFFEQHNARSRYDETRPDAYVFGPTRDQTRRWVDAWMQNPAFDGFNWLDGYVSIPFVPHQAKCLVFGNYDDACTPWFRSRPDLDRTFLETGFDANTYASFIRSQSLERCVCEWPSLPPSSYLRSPPKHAPLRIALCITGHVRNALEGLQTLDLVRSVLDVPGLDVDVYAHTWDLTEAPASWRNLEPSFQNVPVSRDRVDAYLAPVRDRVRTIVVESQPDVPPAWVGRCAGSSNVWAHRFWTIVHAHRRLVDRFDRSYSYVLRLRWDAPYVHVHNHTRPITPQVVRNALVRAVRARPDLLAFPRPTHECIGIDNAAWMSRETFDRWLALCRTPEWFVRPEFSTYPYPEIVMFAAWVTAHLRRDRPHFPLFRSD